MKACFFARVKSPEILDFVEFYRNDIRILEELGFEVVRATRFADVPWDADLYYAWWWGPGGLALLKAKLRGKPIVMTGNVQLPQEVGWWQNLPIHKKALVKACLKLADWNLATCDYELNDLRRLGAVRTSRLYLAVDTDLYSPSREMGKSEEPLIFTVAHLNSHNIYRKRLLDIPRCAPYVLKHFPRVKFVLGGSQEPGFEKLESLVSDLGLSESFVFPGRLSLQDKIAYYHRAWLYLQPSIFEGFGVAISEAMACGTAVISSPVGSIPEVVGDAGFLWDGISHEELGQQICRMIEDASLRQHLGQQARNRVLERFTLSQRKQGMARVIASVLGKYGKRLPVMADQLGPFASR